MNAEHVFVCYYLVTSPFITNTIYSSANKFISRAVEQGP